MSECYMYFVFISLSIKRDMQELGNRLYMIIIKTIKQTVYVYNVIVSTLLFISHTQKECYCFVFTNIGKSGVNLSL